MKNTFILLLLIAFLLIPNTGFAQTPFTDIEDHWAISDIEKVYHKGLMKGTAKDIFAPNKEISRAELAVCLDRIFDLNYDNLRFIKEPSPADFYDDVPENEWYSEAVLRTGLHNIFEVQDRKFKPSQSVTRIEIACAIDRAFDVKKLSVITTQIWPMYSDTAKLNQEEQNAICFMYNTGIMKGKSAKHFVPYGKLTRAELAVIFNRTLATLENAEQYADDNASFNKSVNYRGGLQRNALFNTNGAKQKPVLAWKFATGDMVYSSPVAANGLVFIGSNDGNFYAISNEDGKEAWRFKTGHAVRSSAAIDDNTVYFGSHDHYLYALDVPTGREKWKFQTKGSVESSPVINNDVIYFGSFDGRLYAVDIRTGKEKWNFKTGGMVGSSPSISEGIVYFGSYDGYLYAVDQENGHEVWSFEAGDSIYSTPVVYDGMIYFGSLNGCFYAVDAKTGQKKWNYRTAGSIVWSTPVIDNGIVYFGAYDSNLYALDAKTGQEKWRFWTGKQAIYSSPALADGTIFFGGLDGNFYAVNSKAGQKQWTYEIGSRIESSPFINNGKIYFGSSDGFLYALSAAE